MKIVESPVQGPKLEIEVEVDVMAESQSLSGCSEFAEEMGRSCGLVLVQDLRELFWLTQHLMILILVEHIRI